MSFSRIAVCLFLMGPACAVTIAGDRAAVVSAGADVDEDGGYRFNLGLNWSPSEATVLTALGGRADSSTDFGDFKSTTVLLGADHFFGKVGIAGQVHWWDQADLLNARTLAGSVYFKSGGSRFDVRGETRDSQFETFNFNSIIPVRTLTGVVLAPISGRADCSLDNTAYGASFSHSSGAWLFAVGGTGYDYSDNDCDITNVVLPPQLTQLPVLSREIFRRIAARVLEVTGQLIGSQLTRDNGFLKSSLTAGLQYQLGERTLGVDYYHDEEEFAGLISDTLIGSLGFPLTDRTDLELRLGATDGDLTGTVAFAGATFHLYFGGS